MKLTKMGLKILKSLRSKQNLQFIANKFNVTVDIIRNNYFSWFWRCGYVTKAERGIYILTEKGKDKIKDTEIFYKTEDLILKGAKKGSSNKDIVNFIQEKYNIKRPYSSIYSKISRLRNKFGFIDRRKSIYKIPKKFSPQLAELIGLIFSDGYLHNEGVSFYNKDIAILDRFQKLTFEVFILKKPYKRERRPNFFELNYYSMDVAYYLNKLIQNKRVIPTQILNGNKDIKTSFLRGFFSGDGCVVLSVSHQKFYKKFQIHSHLFLACRRLSITKNIASIFESLGYKVLIRWDGLMISRFEYILKYYNEIGFINKSKIANYSRHWSGFEKNQVLRYIATSMRGDSKLSNLRYGERKDIVKYIQNKLENLKAKVY